MSVLLFGRDLGNRSREEHTGGIAGHRRGGNV